MINLVPPRQGLPKICQKYKNWYLKKPLLEKGSKENLTQHTDQQALNLFSPTRRDAFLVKVTLPTLSDVCVPGKILDY